MMPPKLKTIAYGLVGLGVFLLLLNSGFLAALPSFIWVSLLFAAGAAFWVGSLKSLQFWQRLAGFAGIAIVAMSTSGRFAGTAALGFPGMAFLLIYLLNTKRWWALLPGGILSSLALLVTFKGLFPAWDATPILFLGFAGTFTVLYLLPASRGGKRWALYPAILFIILTVLINDPSGSVPGWFLPILLIGGGAFMLWWWQRNNSR